MNNEVATKCSKCGEPFTGGVIYGNEGGTWHGTCPTNPTTDKIDEILTANFATKPDGKAWCTLHAHKLDLGICVSCKAKSQILALVEEANRQTEIKCLQNVMQQWEYPSLAPNWVHERIAQLNNQLKGETDNE